MTLRWPSGKKENDHKRKCNSRVCCDLTENFVVYMTLELKSDMIVPYAHSCIQYKLWKWTLKWGKFLFFFCHIQIKFKKIFGHFFTLGGLHYGYICKIIKIACSYKCVNHDMCKIKIKLLEENSKWKILDWQGNLSLLHSLLLLLLEKFWAQ